MLGVDSTLESYFTHWLQRREVVELRRTFGRWDF
jgi:hypothetical protein